MNPTTSPTCADPIADLKAMFVDTVLRQRVDSGQDPVRRPVFSKAHGVAQGLLSVRPDLPEELRIGLLRQDALPAWVRFSSDTLPSRTDLKSTLGIGIKLFGVPGRKLLATEADATTHDLVLQNHDVFFVDTATDMCEFTRAGVVDHDYAGYLAEHPTTRQILADMAKSEASVLTATYWSGLPYAFGPDRQVKYKLLPVSAAPADDRAGPPGQDPSYLRSDLRFRLLAGQAVFHLMVQFRTEPDAMPLDRATVRWEEGQSAPVHVATLTLHGQDVAARGQDAYGESLAFQPWHALPEHAPLGSISDARRVVYQASAELRRNVNGVPVGEPDAPRPTMTVHPARDTRIVRAAIHPAIGVARVGNSEEYHLAPEVDDPVPLPFDSYKDATGALRRQAVRFRVYGYNAAGEAVAELTADNADLCWTVHVANKKAAWYEFQIALDIPEATSAPDSRRRNAQVPVEDRGDLTIDPGKRTIRGRNQSGLDHRFDTGQFCGKKVYLGELATDEDGRLIFLGGRGVSASRDGSPATTFANNDGWHDDTSDGPVTAEVRIDGELVPTDPAWVVTAPPNYAPQLRSVRTLHDLLYDAYVSAGILPRPRSVSFRRDILPVLHRMCALQWVNQGFAARFGWGGRDFFLAPGYLARLASPAAVDDDVRRTVFATFRNLDRDGVSPVPWPPVYGDAMSLPPVSAHQHMTVTPTQYWQLEQWAKGNFDADYGTDDDDGTDDDPGNAPARNLGDVDIAEQPSTLDRAALSFCLADAFHPGCEVTWPVRHTTMYSAPFRIRHRDPDQPETDYGNVLTPLAALSRTGPLYGQGAGDLTRWMAVPWQTDTASCRSGYDLGFGRRYDPYLPTFWPARVPNQVLSEEDYQTVVDPSQDISTRLAAFARRRVWDRFFPADYLRRINCMVAEFGKLGVIEVRPGPTDTAEFPPVMMVESETGFGPDTGPALRGLITIHVPESADHAVAARAAAAAVAADDRPDDEVAAGYIDKVARFPHGLR